MKTNNIFIICSISLLLLGCSQKGTINYTYVSTNQVPAEPDRGDAQAQIAEASTSIGHSLQELSAMQMATHPHAQVPPLNARALGMTQVVSVNWNGPVEPLLERIARISHYRYYSIGDQPAIPILVSIDAHQQVLAQILQNVIFQVQSKADVMIDANRKVIVLSYHES